ncbi:MAG: VanW family protein [Mycobacteriaceae bacterium]
MVEAEQVATSTRAKLALSGGAVLALLGIAYAADVLSSRGEVPRGVAISGVHVGGSDTAAAEATLRSALTPRTGIPVEVRAGDVTTMVDPQAAGLTVDWPTTLAQAGGQPLNPITRVRSLFSTHDVGVATTTDRRALDEAVEALRPQTDRPAVEGTIKFTGATPAAVPSAAGQILDVQGAADALVAGWINKGGVELPVRRADVSVTPAALDAALASARTATSADVVVQGNGAVAALRPEDVGAVLSFVPDGRGGLEPKTDIDAAIRILAPQLASTETKTVEAGVVLRDGAPQVVPAVDGLTVDWKATLPGLATLLASTDRKVTATYAAKPATFTTQQARGLGINEVIGEFTTSGFANASGVNIRQVAAKVTGAVVKPGDTFSLNGYTGPRGTAQGYVESGIIIDGHAGTAVGGGISQFATTLYNASYFAGLTDVHHQEHSYYISRYPAAREATVYEGEIDLKFSAPAKTGILIEAIGTGSSITVRIWGTKAVVVESIPGERSTYTAPKMITLPTGKGCSASTGAPGFTTSDTRVVRDARSGQEISRKTRTVRYDPQPVVHCA